MFAYFDLFRIFTHTDLQEENVKHAMEIVVAVMYCILAKDPQYEGTDTAEAPEGQRCHCNNTLVHAQTFDASAIRARYVELSKNVEFDPKKPRKRSRKEGSWLEDKYREFHDGPATES